MSAINQVDALAVERRALGGRRVYAQALALSRRAGCTDIPPYGEYAASPATSVCLTKTLSPAARRGR